MTSPAPRPSEARDRLLATASRLFYRDGIHAVGVDRVIAEAGVTRATFYRHFPGKEDLVRAYLEGEDAALRSFFESAGAAAKSPTDMIEQIVTGIADDVTHNHTRGCPFINASAEYPDAASSVRQTVQRHREWFRSTLRTAFEAAGAADAAQKAGALVLLRDAAMVGGYLDGPGAIRETFTRTARAAAGL